MANACPSLYIVHQSICSFKSSEDVSNVSRVWACVIILSLAFTMQDQLYLLLVVSSE